jgi:hypothetical protein
MEDIVLKNISKEIEEKYDCKVVSIRYAQLLSLCVDIKIKFNDDFIYRPFDDMPKPDMICFSEKTINFYKRVDLFDCVKNNNLN